MVTQTTDGTVVFRFFRPQSKRVTITGEFNSWNKSSTPMSKDGEGWWRCELKLAPGCYQFLYVSDGEYHRDYAAFGLTPAAFGMNSVVKVDAPVVKFPAEDSQPVATVQTTRTRRRASKKRRGPDKVAVA
jgi:1,4-alpha-glucan branching enzyme